MMIDAAAFIAAAESMINTPFRHQGRVPGVGLDCGGLVVCALRQIGYPVIDASKGYGRIPAKGTLEKVVEENCDRITEEELAAGDICMFKFRSEPQHVAIFSENQLIHGWQDIGKVVMHDFDAVWHERLTGCYRLKDR